MAEGFLNITGITAPESASEGEIVNFTIHTQNTGDTDNFKLELTEDLIASHEFSLEVGLTYDIPVQFIMLNHDVNIIITTYHLEEPTGFVIFRTTDLLYGSGSAVAYIDVCGNELIAYGRTSGACTDHRCEHIDQDLNIPSASGSTKMWIRDEENICICEDGAMSGYSRRFNVNDSDAIKVSTSPTIENPDYEMTC